jgi:hypothetical protein
MTGSETDFLEALQEKSSNRAGKTMIEQGIPEKRRSIADISNENTHFNEVNDTTQCPGE